MFAGKSCFHSVGKCNLLMFGRVCNKRNVALSKTVTSVDPCLLLAIINFDENYETKVLNSSELLTVDKTMIVRMGLEISSNIVNRWRGCEIKMWFPFICLLKNEDMVCLFQNYVIPML